MAIQTSPAAPSPAPRPFTRAFALVLATGAGAGYSPVASGTAGAAVGVVLYAGIAAFPFVLLAPTLVALVALSVWAADQACRHWGTEDDGRIVIDEIAGQILTLAPLGLLGAAGSLGWLVTGFVTFRVLDVWKPGPVRWLEENLPGGAGVVMDDVLAGVIGAVLMTVAVASVG